MLGTETLALLWVPDIIRDDALFSLLDHVPASLFLQIQNERWELNHLRFTQLLMHLPFTQILPFAQTSSLSLGKCRSWGTCF